MNRQEKRAKLKRRRIQEVARNKMILFTAIAMIVVIGSIGCKSFFASAHAGTNEPIQYKYYKSIVIEDGDTLWNIAREYASSQMTTKECVQEMKELNQLSSETIQEGRHLVVPYYDMQYK